MEFDSKGHTPLACLVRQSIMFIHSVQRNLFKGQSVTCKVAQVVPAHGVDVCLSNFISERSMVLGQEMIEFFVNDEHSLLNDLRINIW